MNLPPISQLLVIMTSVNPPKENLLLKRNPNNGKFMLTSKDGMNIITNEVTVPYPIRLNEKSGFMTVALGKKDTTFSDYLASIDEYLKSSFESFNKKFNGDVVYKSLFKSPMKKVKGKLVLNEKSLEKYGYTIDLRLNKVSNRIKGEVNYDGKKLRNLETFEFESIVHPGTRVICVLRPTLWQKDNEVQLMPTLLRLKVREPEYSDIDLDEYCGDNTIVSEFETLDLD